MKKSLNGNVPNIPPHVSYYKQYKSIIVLAVIMFNLLIVAGIAANESVDKMTDKKVYNCGWCKISKLISNAGYRDFVDADLTRANWDAISRNADGTSIRVININTKKVIVFNCDGSFKQLELPNFNSWLDNNNNILTWMDKEKGNYNSIKYFKGNPPNAMDPSGQYFVANINKGNGEIFSVAKPNIPLARINIISQSGLCMFFKENKLYVFGHDKRGLSTPLKGFIYEREGVNFRLAKEFEIPREKKAESPYVVEDMSPWSDEILLVDVYDFPSFSKRYIFNLKTKELKYYGLVTKEKCLFLQCDILKKVEENKKSKMSSGETTE